MVVFALEAKLEVRLELTALSASLGAEETICAGLACGLNAVKKKTEEMMPIRRLLSTKQFSQVRVSWPGTVSGVHLNLDDCILQKVCGHASL